MTFANFFKGGSKREPPPPPGGPRKRKASGQLEGYQRTYGEKDGRTVFEAAQIKAKRRKKR